MGAGFYVNPILGHEHRDSGARPLVILEGRQTAIYSTRSEVNPRRDLTSFRLHTETAYPVFKKDPRADINSYVSKCEVIVFASAFIKKLLRVIFRWLIFCRNWSISLKNLADVIGVKLGRYYIAILETILKVQLLILKNCIYFFND